MKTWILVKTELFFYSIKKFLFNIISSTSGVILDCVWHEILTKPQTIGKQTKNFFFFFYFALSRYILKFRNSLCLNQQLDFSETWDDEFVFSHNHWTVHLNLIMLHITVILAFAFFLLLASFFWNDDFRRHHQSQKN